MGSTWLDMGPYSVRMKRTGSRKLSKCLPDPWGPIKIQKIPKIPENPGNPGKFRKSEYIELPIYRPIKAAAMLT